MVFPLGAALIICVIQSKALKYNILCVLFFPEGSICFPPGAPEGWVTTSMREKDETCRWDHHPRMYYVKCPIDTPTHTQLLVALLESHDDRVRQQEVKTVVLLFTEMPLLNQEKSENLANIKYS